MERAVIVDFSSLFSIQAKMEIMEKGKWRRRKKGEEKGKMLIQTLAEPGPITVFSPLLSERSRSIVFICL